MSTRKISPDKSEASKKGLNTIVTLEMPTDAAEKLVELVRSGKAPQLEAEFPGIAIEIASKPEDDELETR